METPTQISAAEMFKATRAEAASVGQRLADMAPKVNGRADWSSVLDSVKLASRSAVRNPGLSIPISLAPDVNQSVGFPVRFSSADLVPPPDIYPASEVWPSPPASPLSAIGESYPASLLINSYPDIVSQDHSAIPNPDVAEKVKSPRVGAAKRFGRSVSQLSLGQKAILAFGGLGLLATGAASLRPNHQPTPTPAYRPEISAPPVRSETAPSAIIPASGRFATPTSEIYIPGTSQKTSAVGIGSMNILGFAGEHRFKVQDAKTGKQYEVPIGEMVVERGSVVKKENMPRSELLGIRNNSSELMHFVPEMGASSVRIVQDDNEVSSAPLLRQSIEAAKRENLKILYTFNPSTLLTKEETHTRLESLFTTLGDYKNFEIELGNEPDNNDFGHPLWEGRDLIKFAKFIKITSDEVQKMRPGTKMNMGALVDLSKMPWLMTYLKNEGVDVNNFSFSVHAYNTPEDITRRVDATRRLTGRPVIISELGTSSEDPNRLSELLNVALKSGIPTWVHELPNFEGFGTVEPNGRPNARFYTVQSDVLTQAIPVKS